MKVEGSSRASAGGREMGAERGEVQQMEHGMGERQGAGEGSAAGAGRAMVEDWLRAMTRAGASDLILRAGQRPAWRVAGELEFISGPLPGNAALEGAICSFLDLDRQARWRSTGSVDGSVEILRGGRFRMNAYHQRGRPAAVFRRIHATAPRLVDLGLPRPELENLALGERGLVLVTGVAGAGKSTTLAAMLQHRNECRGGHLITLEDPVEFLFDEERCVISQREVGTDCSSFAEGLRHALRQSPDVLVIGEMRDAETVVAALEAAETGHLVCSTLHTVNVIQTVDRILDFFPASRSEEIRGRLARHLNGVISQRLLSALPVPGRRENPGAKAAAVREQIPAWELMVPSPTSRQLLEEGDTPGLEALLDARRDPGQASFNRCLEDLVAAGRITPETALAASDRPGELQLAMRGLKGGQETVHRGPAHRAPLGEDSESELEGLGPEPAPALPAPGNSPPAEGAPGQERSKPGQTAAPGPRAGGLRLVSRLRPRPDPRPPAGGGPARETTDGAPE
ncbi:MAG: PilT/PilU family type 4a pilus ATPase [Planctomycetota bacterium]|nr:PilT/PilU family type 4a pilus ATPase [Planctomycetota bacterium]MDP6519398.1 PilT/PilU family type 4a pilus ATPase [Planctomycetota bacterium]MDP6838174.1 PilT/PilU family type 4a pilus ATPase [Planctomycetota bacterium]